MLTASIGARIAALLFSQIISLGYRYLQNTEAVMALETVRIADRITVIVNLMEGLEPPEQAAWAFQSEGTNMPIIVSPESWVADDASRDAEAQLLYDLLQKSLFTAGSRRILVSNIETLSTEHPANTRRAGISSKWSNPTLFPELIAEVVTELRGGPTLVVSVQLSNGTWLNAVAAYAETLDFWRPQDVALAAFMALTIAALSIYAIRRLTYPIRAFANAATRLGTDVNAPAIEEHGSLEVRDAIQAFNDMQSRIQRLLEDRTQMLAAVSHDLRTPITRLRLRSEFVEDIDQRKKLLTDLREMEDMIDGVLAFAKEDSVTEPTVNVDLTAMLRSICDEIADTGGRVKFAGNPGRVLHPCRRLSMRRCFVNLIENAVKYGGHTQVKLAARDQLIEVTIDDQGPGIPEAEHESVFRPFHRLDKSRGKDSGGSGLGLSVARSIARAHGGDVIISNRSEGGLRVQVRF